MRFADVIAELKDRYRAALEKADGALHQPTDAETALMMRQFVLGVPPAPRDEQDVTDNDIERWTRGVGISVETLFDCVGMYLAQGFHTGTLSFSFCDRVVNVLNAFAYDSHSFYAAHAKKRPLLGPPELFGAIYFAFDAGEYWHRGDDRDPVISYTRPAIAKIVEESSGFRYPDDSL